MLPLFIDVARLELVLVGNGPAALRRLKLLEEAGACRLAVFAADPDAALASAAGSRLVRRWPTRDDLGRTQLLFVADVPDAIRTQLAAEARLLGVITHVEDQPALSDSHSPAVVRRGALTLAVSTGGGSPALAARVRDFLGRLFGPEWRGRLEELARQRRAWREAGVPHDAIATLTGEWVDRRGWLSGNSESATRH